MDDLTERDFFAAMALQSVTHPHLLSRITQSGDVPAAIAGACYKVADAMMAERARNAQDASAKAGTASVSAGPGA